MTCARRHRFLERNEEARDEDPDDTARGKGSWVEGRSKGVMKGDIGDGSPHGSTNMGPISTEYSTTGFATYDNFEAHSQCLSDGRVRTKHTHVDK